MYIRNEVEKTENASCFESEQTLPLRLHRRNSPTYVQLQLVTFLQIFTIASHQHLALSHFAFLYTESTMEPTNDGGVVLSLFLMVTSISYALFSCIAIYERSAATTAAESATLRLLRKLSGFANLSNSFIHILLTVYMKANESNLSEYWIEERKLGGIEGPVGLVILNLAAAISALLHNKMTVPLYWNASTHSKII